MEIIEIKNKEKEKVREAGFVKVFYKVSYNQEEEDSDGVYYTKHESIGIRETDISRLEFTEEEILDINDEKYTAELLFATDEKNEIIKKYGGN